MRIRFDRPDAATVEAAAVDLTTRMIRGVGVPWNVVGYASTGPVKFLPGSLPLDGPPPKLLRDHDSEDAIGLVVARSADAERCYWTAKVSATASGDEALILAADGVLDASSIGATPTDYTYDGPILVVRKAEWDEQSLVVFAAFDAPILEVAANRHPYPVLSPSETPESETPMPDTDPAPAPTVTATVPTAPLQVLATSPETPHITPEMLGRAMAAASRGQRAPRPFIEAARWVIATITGDTNTLRVLAADTAPNETTDSIPGLIPEYLVGNVFDTLSGRRPVITAFGTSAMPGGGETFNRRYVSDHTESDIQNDQLDDLATALYKVQKQQVAKKWYGGRLNLSEQAQAYSDVNLVGLVLADMAKIYARKTDVYCSQQLFAARTVATATISDATDGDEVINKLYAGAAELFTFCDELPTHLVISTSTWVNFGSAKDSGGNRVFPYLGPLNAGGTAQGVTSFGMNPLGLTLVVTDRLGPSPSDGDQGLLVYGPAVELFEDQRGALAIENPSNLSTTLAFRGVIAANVMPVLSGSAVLDLFDNN